MLRLYDPETRDLTAPRLPRLTELELDRKLIGLLAQIDRPIVERMEAIKELFALHAADCAMRNIPIDAYTDKDGP